MFSGTSSLNVRSDCFALILNLGGCTSQRHNADGRAVRAGLRVGLGCDLSLRGVAAVLAIGIGAAAAAIAIIGPFITILCYVKFEHALFKLSIVVWSLLMNVAGKAV